MSNTIKPDEPIDLASLTYERQGGSATMWSDAPNSGTIVERTAAPPVRESLSDRIADRIAAALAKKLGR
jgi:hypothetical protein